MLFFGDFLPEIGPTNSPTANQLFPLETRELKLDPSAALARNKEAAFKHTIEYNPAEIPY